MDRRVIPPKRVTSPTLGPPPLCKQALSWLCRILAGVPGGRQQTMLLLQVDKRLELTSLFVIQHPPAILCKLRRSYATVFFKHNFHEKGKEASIKTRSTPASYSLKGQHTKHNCKMVNSPSQICRRPASLPRRRFQGNLISSYHFPENSRVGGFLLDISRKRESRVIPFSKSVGSTFGMDP